MFSRLFEMLTIQFFRQMCFAFKKGLVKVSRFFPENAGQPEVETVKTDLHVKI